MTTHISQASIFDQHPAETLATPKVEYEPLWYAGHEELFHILLDTLTWNTQFRSRSTVSFGVSYTKRSGLSHRRPFPDYLQHIANLVKQRFGYIPNNCLANYYPTGEHYINFHSDQDMEMKTHSGVAIVSLGTTRLMELRKIDNHQIRYAYPLEPGSVFYMEDVLQKEWQHGIMQQRESGARISLSFRALREDLDQ
ncbi:MAG: alpha-ketoglutarate-dependent dioxygenase AlkB [Acidiferrobacterales bacterium]|nr:alpha-ketoglutarate-dependent dioxygenase AlkB [Acidiferrobacterales bacterium]